MVNLSKRRKDNYIKTINDLLVDMFGCRLDDDRLWREWLNVKVKDVDMFMRSGVRDSFKARLIAISLTPTFKWIPFHCEKNSFDFHSVWNAVTLSSISPELQKFTAELIKINVDEIKSGRPDPDLYLSFYYYNKIILQFLALLPEDDPLAKEMFDCYEINDPIPSSNSGYNPFINLLSEPLIPRKWKESADKKMKEIVKSEEEDFQEPRCEWEGALKNYIRHIQNVSYNGRVPYHSDLFAGQIDFLLNLSESRIRFDDIHIYGILTIIRFPEYKELRHRFARHVVLGGDFSGHGGTVHYAARIMLNDFGEIDEELENRLEDLIFKSRKKMAEEESVMNDHKKKISSLVEQMS